MNNTHRRRASRAAGYCSIFALGLAASALGCLERPIEPLDSHATWGIQERLAQVVVTRLDLLLAIDNSGSMSDKQEILALAVPDLVRGLVNPRCVDDTGAPTATQPDGPLSDCPPGAAREFPPILDIHIGIVSSSLGGHGGDLCGQPGDDNDAGHLLSRRSQTPGDDVPTYEGLGFLAWDPAQQLTPPGEGTIGDAGGTAGLVPALRDMVRGVGQTGCGLEAQLESWYRFLADPNPHATIEVVGGVARKNGTDEVLLSQRRDFLRPDSLLAILMLSDENDCSLRDGGGAWAAANSARLPRARSVCAAAPDDACCGPCDDEALAARCGDDPICATPLSDAEDPVNLRCFDQKRRFGVDHLYPIERYMNALRLPRLDPEAPTLAPAAGVEGVPNPIFSRLDPDDTTSRVRDPSLVFLAGIVGVPWQDVARDPADLTRGFKTVAELAEPAGDGLTGWDVILGDPARRVPPRDPHMVESITPREGLPTSSTPLADPVSGHEWDTAGKDLQYACIFPLPTPIDCAQADCDCDADNPVCDPPYDGTQPEQPRAKAYPGLRQLGVLRGMEDQGIVASVCPAQLAAPDAPDFGYRPAIGAIIDRLRVRIGGQCLPRSLSPDESGQVTCAIVEARHIDGGTCCDPAEGRVPVAESHAGIQRDLEEISRTAAAQDPSSEAAQWNCYCEIPQLEGRAEGEPLWACQNDPSPAPTLPGGAPVDGYCYIDATTAPPLGNPALVEGCPVTERRRIRFVGKGIPDSTATLYITCTGD